MKSIQRKAVLLVIFTMTAVSLVSAQESEREKIAREEDVLEGKPEEAEGIGLTVGLEAGFGNVVDEAEFSIMPNVVYEKSFIDGALDVFGEIDYTATFSDPAKQELYIEEEVGYNLDVIEGGTLSIILNNNNTFQIEPELEDGETYVGAFEPALKWTQGLNFGDLWIKFGLPIGYLTGVKDADTEVGLNTTLGWDSTFGLSVEFGLGFMLAPDSDLGAYGLKVSYDNEGLISGEVEFAANKEFKEIGIVPEIDVNLDFGLTFYAKAEIIVVDGADDPAITPFIGIKYSF